MKKVEIYGTPVCTYCVMAKDFLKKNNIAYTEYNVATNNVKKEEMIEKSGQFGVPVIVVDNENIVVGFDEKVLKNLLAVK
ncbi:MAG: glutaredoxin domain-containing protein [Patescibacteria group bacterium]